MSDHGTFSAIVDAVLARTLRKGDLQDVISYVRASVRECAALAFFDQDSNELEVTVDAIPFVWKIPQEFRQMGFVRYPYFNRDNTEVIPKDKSPAHVTRNDVYWYYRTGDSYVFSGLAVGDTIKLYYYAFPKALRYIALEADRPARFDIDTNAWLYLPDYDSTEETREAARSLVTTWLMFRWSDMLVEGACAKLWKAKNDERASSAYALFKSYQKDLLSGESHSTVGE